MNNYNIIEEKIEKLTELVLALDKKREIDTQMMFDQVEALEFFLEELDNRVKNLRNE